MSDSNLFPWLALLLAMLSAIAVPLAKGFYSMRAFQKYATSVIGSTKPVNMLLTRIDEQFLWWNSNHSPGYRIDLTPAETNQTDQTNQTNQTKIQGLKVDPVDASSVQKWIALYDAIQSGGESVVAEVYFDQHNQPVALSVKGALAYKAGWWGA